MVAHLHLVGAGLAHVDLDQFHLFGTAGLFDTDDLGHGGLLEKVHRYRRVRRRRAVYCARAVCVLSLIHI